MLNIAKSLKRVFGNENDRIVKKMQLKVSEINALEPNYQALDDASLTAKTAEFKERLAAGESVDHLLVEAFATVREASKRVLNMRHFDVQLLGGIVLHQGKITEMKTGEGKTLVATLAVYLNALSGKGVHVVTVNDYLASRDAAWMGKIYEFLGLSVGVVIPNLQDDLRKQAYAADITYGTNNEFGFDYLRDNLKFRAEELVQRDFNYAIVDEVDSILIDEARTPLIISGPVQGTSELYVGIDAIIPKLVAEDYEMDEKSRAISLTDGGQEHVESLLKAEGLLDQDSNLYDLQNVSLVHHVNQALRAHHLFRLDKDYLIKEARVVLIDEFTGRMMEGRRYSDGLHQALEAKEGQPIQMENQTLAQITFQNYFRMYPKLAGMTGTAMTEAGEFDQIYGLEVIEMPTNKPMSRIDADDEVYRTSDERDQAVIDQIKACNAAGQPVLIGTASIEKSEQLSKALQKAGIDHKVLNARQHEKEAFIIARAGVPGAVTLATNMAGRGTDIQLGGNADMQLKEALSDKQNAAQQQSLADQINQTIQAQKQQVLDAGGLMVIGTERHESRRIDNQLRGRAGRQGDPGASKFYVSLQDDLMRIFGSNRLETMLAKLGLQDGEAIIHPWVSKALETAQKKVEERNFEIRKQLLKFDDVMNDQRKVVFEQRRELMLDNDVSETVKSMRHDTLDALMNDYLPPKSLPDQWDIDGLHTAIMEKFGLDLPLGEWADAEGNGVAEIHEQVKQKIEDRMAAKAVRYGAPVMRLIERNALLQILDSSWKDHLLQLDHLKQGIGLRAYAQRDPLNEYKQEAFSLFEAMLDQLRERVTTFLSHVELRMRDGQDQESLNVLPSAPALIVEQHDDGAALADASNLPAASSQDVEQTAKTMTRLPKIGKHSPDQAPPKPGMEFDKDLSRWIDRNDPNSWGKVPRNAICPCNSGKKYKHCHGKI
ncbi:MAG: preprotein translocase subunit SecA [Alphaproteobacteria bacterium]